MAFILKDRVKENSTTTGTGNISLGGASATFDTFQSYLTNGDTTYYAIAHTSSGVDEWEVGLGTWNTGNTLSRTTVLAGSNGTSAVNFSAGTKDIFMTYPASKAAVVSEDVTFADITVTGTVDGRDVAADGSKLDGIDTSADVTDAVTVAAAGALMRSGGTMTGNLILNADPNAALGAATKQYVDTIASAGIHYHAPVRAEHPSNLNATYNNGSSGVGATLTNAGTNAALVIDSVSMVLNDRVLVANQTDQTQNGVYTVTTVGDGSTAWVLTRSTDTDTAAPSDPDAFGKGDAFFIKEGSTNAGHLDVLSTSGTIVFGTTNIVFSEVAETTVYSGGTGITLTGTTFSIGQDVGTTSNVTFNQVTAAIIGNVTGNLTGDVTGNADTATALETARTIQLSGDVTGSASFDGTANINITAAVQDDSHAHVISNVDGLQSALDAKVPTSRIITAGNGLTGGGDLSANRTLTVGAGGGITVTADTVAHADTSSQASVNNSMPNVIQDITLDTYGHVTNIASANLDDRYYTESEADSRYVNVTGDTMSGNLDFNNNQILNLNHLGLGGQIYHVGDTNTYHEFHTTDHWRVVVGGSERLEVKAGTGGGGSPHVEVTGDLKATSNMYIAGDRVFSEAYHPNADKWTTARTLSLSGDASGSVSWDGSANATLSVAVADDSHNHTISNIDNLSVGGLTGMRLTTTSGYIEFGPANTNWAHIYTDRPNFYFNKELYVNNQRVFNDAYHPNADKWTTARTLSLSGDASGSVSWDGSANATLSVTVANDSHTHDGRYYTESEADSRFTSSDHFKWRGTGYLSSTTTSALKTELLGDDVFDSYVSAFKTGWSYAGNGDLTDAGRLTELAGTSWLTWTDNSSDNVQGNFTALVIAPNTGGSAGKMFVYNDQGSSYSPGWREIWTSSSDGSGSGLDADLLDGYHESSFIRKGVGYTWTGTGNSNLLRFQSENTIDTSTAYQASLEVFQDNAGADAFMAFHIGGDYAAYFGLHGGINDFVVGGWSKGSAYQRVFHDGYHPNADKWTTARTLSLSGDASGSVSWDGSGNATLSVTVANDSHSHSNYITSNANDTTSGIITFGPNSIWSKYLKIGGNANNSDANSGSIGVTNGNLHIDAANGSFTTYLNYYDGTGGVAFGSGGSTIVAWMGPDGDLWKGGADNSGSKYWHAGNDGSGSGLDADTVDGTHKANFLGNHQTNNMTIVNRGHYSTSTSAQNQNSGQISYGFNYQIDGTWTHPYPDLIVGYHTGMRMGGLTNYGGVRFYADHPSRTSTRILDVGNGNSNVHAINSFSAGGNITAYSSDKRLKENFKPISTPIEKISKLNGCSFDWIEEIEDLGFTPDMAKNDVGLIAQEVEAVYPQAVAPAPFDHEVDLADGKFKSKSGKNFLTVKYEKLVPLLVEAIKEQQKQIDELKKGLEAK